MTSLELENFFMGAKKIILLQASFFNDLCFFLSFETCQVPGSEGGMRILESSLDSKLNVTVMQ